MTDSDLEEVLKKSTHTLKSEPGYKLRYGFKSEAQFPFFCIWEEFWHGGKVIHANSLYIQDGLEPFS